MTKTTVRDWLKKPIVGILLAIAIGFAVGAIVLLIAGYNPGEAYGALFRGVFSKPKYFAQVTIKSTPIILTGISFVVAFKSGLFNIGSEGQYITGALVAAIVGSQINLPPVIHFIVVILAAMVAAGLVGALVGFLKSRFHVHEVISCVMINWIMLYLSNYMITLPWFKKAGTEASVEALESSWSVVANNWKTSEEGLQQLAGSDSPWAEALLKTDLNYGILIAVIVAIGIYLLYKNTVKGYELRAVGINPHAAKLAGISVDKSIVTSMAISAAIAGLAGALTITGVMPHRVTQLSMHEGYGFAGISVALIGGGSPIGSIFSGIFYSMLTYGSASIQSETGAAGEIMDIVIGVIIYLIAISSLIIMLLNRKSAKAGKAAKNG
ncbi:ABC transporter permease [Christensenellaceae bacterium OttesenSCG-928-K19]|nr:ABC transporter permease [Christensenellaceae bacterium OttesenSCG-928-K19]